jgi:ElaB/YqjD/DUF883 family membrane-anchored ribosome-binding protein
MTDADAVGHDPAKIERDIERTQDEMSRTVDRIGDQLTPRNLFNALLDQADSNNIDARKLLDGARRNPVALAMIAGGAIWLASDADAKLPSLGSGGGQQSPDLDHHHRDYIAHMERVEMRDGEEPASYQRRRDLARSNYFMVERGHEEDETSFRQRLDSVADKFREQRHAWADQTREAGGAVAESGKAALAKTKAVYASNPLVGGLAAAAVGALLGSLLPATAAEEGALAGIGQKARDIAAEQKDKIVEVARDQKDQLVSAAEDLVSTAQQPAEGAAPV